MREHPWCRDCPKLYAHAWAWPECQMSCPGRFQLPPASLSPARGVDMRPSSLLKRG
jgi:hypothetical protein